MIPATKQRIHFLLLLLIGICLSFLTSLAAAFVSNAPLFGLHRPTTNRSESKIVLFAAKKAAKKIQVKMLKSVPGTGQTGDIVQVTPAFFQNKLQPSRSAEVISDEEVKKEQSEKAAAKEQERQEATAIKDILDGTTINIERKAGPDGQLFGGIGPKVIMDELLNKLAGHEEFLNRKGVKVVAVTDENGMKMRQDIKHTGEFGAQIALTSDISSTVKIAVKAQE